jgi:hypothetical protein
MFTFLCKSQISLTCNVISFSGDTLALSTILSDKCVIFLHNNPSCTACKKELGSFLYNNIDTSEFKIVAISRMLYFPSSFWGTDSYLRNLCPKISATYFDFSSAKSINSLSLNNDGVFGMFRIIHAPSLILKNKDEFLTVQYEEIFEEYFVSEKSKKIIRDFLNK